MLREFQSLFRRSLFEDKDAFVARFIQTKGSDATTRFDIHRNNFRISLVEVIRAAFPAVNYFAGEDNFSYAAGRFLEAYPPRIPRLSAYGDQFSKFLENFTPAQSMPWLIDLAKLEWACQESLFAADADPLRIENIAQLKDAAPIRLMVVPSLRVVASSYPVLSLWEQAQMEQTLALQGSSPNLAKSGETALLVRPHNDVEFHRLQPGEAALITAIREGQDLAEALESASRAQPGQNLGYILAVLVARGCFLSSGVS